MMEMMMAMADGGSMFVIGFVSLLISSSRAKAIVHDKFHFIPFHFTFAQDYELAGNVFEVG